MAIRSGLAAQIGIGVESTVGTAATPTRFYEFNDESIAMTIERIESEGLRTGNRVLRSDRYASGQKAIEGSFSMDMTADNTAILFKHALGAVATAGSYVHTCTMSDPFGLGLTIEVGRPGNDGTVRAFTYAGCKINTLDLSVSVGELLSAEFGVIGTTAETIGTVTAASYASSLELLHFAGAAITVAGTAYPCKDFSLSVNNGLTGDRYVLGSQIAQQPIASSLAEVTGSLTAEFVDATAYNRVVNAAAVCGDGHAPLHFAVGAHHVWKIEIDFETRAVFHELDAISIEDLTSHGWQSDCDLGAGIDLGCVFGPAHDLHVP